MRFSPQPEAPAEFDWHEFRAGDANCEHDRVFSGERFCNGNPGWVWICDKCGASAVRSFGPEGKPPAREPKRFADTWEKFMGERLDHLDRIAATHAKI